jgi:thiol-disulfide isomerase/thioredoxin
MNLFDKFPMAVTLHEFLGRYATADQVTRWREAHLKVVLSGDQKQLLESFVRTTNILCLAGAWCGDCINQCPIFEHFAAAASVLRVRYLDRDENAEVRQELQINGGRRVPVVVFFSEDGFEVARYGERTLSKYRQMMTSQLGSHCPPNVVAPKVDLLPQAVQDWLNEFERVQWILRLSTRLRQIHGD